MARKSKLPGICCTDPHAVGYRIAFRVGYQWYVNKLLATDLEQFDFSCDA